MNLIAGSLHLTGQFALAALLGASLWVYLATRLALPVSTTHAITGAVVVTGAIALGIDKVLWGNLESKILLPLLLSPLIALVLGRVLFRLINLLSALKLNYDLVHWLSS